MDSDAGPSQVDPSPNPQNAMQTLPYVYLFAPACALILILIWREAARQGFSRDCVAAAMAACAAGAVIGSKVIMFDFHTPVYGEKTFLGAVVGGIVTLVVVMKALRLDARAFDVPVIPVLWGAALGRIGCFVAGCCHGIPTTVPWGVRYAHMSEPVHATQLYESVLDVALVVLLARYRSSFRRPGSLALAGGVGIAAIRFVVDPLRASAVPGFGLTVVQWTTLAVAIAAALAFIVRERASADAEAAMSDTPSRFAPISVLVAIAALTIATCNWLTPLEVMLITTVSFAAAFVVFDRLVPRMILSSPVIGAAAFLPLQVQDPKPDTIVERRYFAIGGSGMGGGYEVTTEDCEGNTVTRAQHTYSVGAVTAEVRQDQSSGRGSGLRFTVFGGSDRSPAPTYVQSPPSPPLPGDTARRDRVAGATFVGMYDWSWVGLKAGVTTGQWAFPSEHPLFGSRASSKTLPALFLRIGKVTGLHGEVDVGTHHPAPAPTPYVKAGLAFGDTTGTRLVRLGVSNAGAYVGGRVLNKQGFEFEPFLSLGSTTQRQFGLSIKKRLYLRPNIIVRPSPPPPRVVGEASNSPRR